MVRKILKAEMFPIHQMAPVCTPPGSLSPECEPLSPVFDNSNESYNSNQASTELGIYYSSQPGTPSACMPNALPSHQEWNGQGPAHGAWIMQLPYHEHNQECNQIYPAGMNPYEATDNYSSTYPYCTIPTPAPSHMAHYGFAVDQIPLENVPPTFDYQSSSYPAISEENRPQQAYQDGSGLYLAGGLEMHLFHTPFTHLQPPATTSQPLSPTLSNSSSPRIVPTEVEYQTSSTVIKEEPFRRNSSSSLSNVPDFEMRSSCERFRHKRPRKGERSFFCSKPGCKSKGFDRQYNYQSHLETHDDSRPRIYCDLPDPKCQYGEKKCKYAEKGFVRQHDLARHINTVHLHKEGVICPDCERKLTRKDTLQRHQGNACQKRKRIGGKQGPPRRIGKNRCVADWAPKMVQQMV